VPASQHHNNQSFKGEFQAMSSENDQKMSPNESAEKAAEEATRIGTDTEIRSADKKKHEASTPKNDRLRDASQ
jgi:hypothetical protein